MWVLCTHGFPDVVKVHVVLQADVSPPMRSRGIDLIRAETIPDDVDDISTTLQDLQRRVADNGVIFTSGGIGPTHDDVTYEGIAKACGEVSLCSRPTKLVGPPSSHLHRTLGCRIADMKLQRHEPTIERMKEHYSKRGLELNEARLRMATLPSPAQASFCM